MWRKTRSRSTWRCYGADPNRNWDYNWGGELSAVDKSSFHHFCPARKRQTYPSIVYRVMQSFFNGLSRIQFLQRPLRLPNLRRVPAILREGDQDSLWVRLQHREPAGLRGVPLVCADAAAALLRLYGSCWQLWWLGKIIFKSNVGFLGVLEGGSCWLSSYWRIRLLIPQAQQLIILLLGYQVCPRKVIYLITVVIYFTFL